MRAHSRLNETKSNRAKSNRHRRTIIANNCGCIAVVIVFFFCVFDYCSAEMQCHMKMKIVMEMEMEIETNKQMMANSSGNGDSGGDSDSGGSGRISNGNNYCSIGAGSNHYRNQQQFHHDFECNAKRNVAHKYTHTHTLTLIRTLSNNYKLAVIVLDDDFHIRRSTMRKIADCQAKAIHSRCQSQRQQIGCRLSALLCQVTPIIMRVLFDWSTCCKNFLNSMIYKWTYVCVYVVVWVGEARSALIKKHLL